MATFYIQLENKLLQISGELTAENISKALGYVPVSPNVANELSQRVDNITFDSLKDNPFLQDGSGELNIVDEAGNIIAKVDADGIHSVDFIAGEHRLTNKTDKTYVDEAVKNVKVDLTGYATEEYVNNIDFYNIKDNPIVNNGDGKLLFVDENGYIGLQLEENGLYVKDVIADGHTLSQKADKSDIPSLDGYATESYVNTNLQNYATKDEVSDLVDMSVVTELQGKVNTLIDTDADKSVRDIAVDVLTETLVSETATEAYDTLAEMSAWIKSHPEDASAMNTAIQKNATDIQSNATAISNLDAAYKAADTKVLTDAQEYTDNINFYTIKDNPIVDGEAGSITFVDETGYIGLKVTEDGIVAKDVVTPEHTLSSKADKTFVEDNYYNKSTVDKKIAEAVTGGQVSLDGFATEQWVNEQGFLKEHQDISHLAEKSELPTKTSDLTNDSGFITINDVPEVTVPTKVSELENDKGYLTEHQDISHLATKAELPTVPKKVSELENDSKYITIDEVPEVTVPTKTSELTNDSGFITINDVPVLEIPEEYVTETELSDKGFLTEHQDISHLASRNWVESQGYAHQEDLLEISFNDIQDSPIHIDDSGMINFVDESGNVGFQINEEGLRVTDVIAGEHKLSEKANVSDIPSLDGYAKTEDIPSVDGLVKTEDLPNFDEFAKTEDIPSLEGYAKTSDIPSLDGYASKEWVNNRNYATEYDLKNIDYSTINNVPVSEDETGELNITDESGNIGMKVASEAVYAKDFIAGEHKLSEKVDKTYVDNLELDELNAVLVDTDAEADDPIVPDYVTETELNTALSNKMDKVTLSKVATSGNYNDLSNKPTIPSVVTESTVSGWGFTKNTGTYSKPSGGIPKTDLASAVQTSLGKADTALQSYTEQYKGTVTGVKINGTTKSQSNGIVDLGTVITAHQTLKTINGQSIVGSGNIVISGGGGSSSGGSGAYSEVNHGTSDTTFTLTPNTFHVWDEVASLTLDFGSETSGVANEYLFQFISGATATSLTLPDDIKWTGGEVPAIEVNKIYQISILKRLASVLEWDNAKTLTDNLCTYDGFKTVTFQYPVASDVNVYIGVTMDNAKMISLSVGETTGTLSFISDPGSGILAISPTRDNTYNYIF